MFIDAAHEYEDVKQDALLWYPKIRQGGYMLGHDINPPKLKKQLTKYLEQIGPSKEAKDMVLKKINLEKVNSKLHWTTLYSEKTLLATIGILTMFGSGMEKLYSMVLNTPR